MQARQRSILKLSREAPLWSNKIPVSRHERKPEIRMVPEQVLILTTLEQECCDKATD